VQTILGEIQTKSSKGIEKSEAGSMKQQNERTQVMLSTPPPTIIRQVNADKQHWREM
jgi:hypothetical protein